MNKNLLILLLKYGLGLGLLGWVIWSHWDYLTPDGQHTGLAYISQRPWQPFFFVLALVLCLSSLMVTFVRWFILVRAQGLPFQLRDAFRLGLVGYFFNTFLPGSVGGDLVKSAVLIREQSRRTVAVATVLIDRILGMCGLVWLTALLGGVFWASGLLPQLATTPRAAAVLETIILGASLLAGASLIFWVVLGFFSEGLAERWALKLEDFPKIGGVLAELWRAGFLYRRRGRQVGIALLLAMVGHLGFILTFYCAARSVTAPADLPSLAANFLIIPVGMVIQAGFPTPGGLGGGEWAFTTMYELLGSSAGVFGSLLYRVIGWIIGGVGYFVYLRMKPQLQPAPTSTSPDSLPPSTRTAP